MASFIEFPIFTGVSGDLRPWISWLEAFFVREKFKKLEKMNLAQSLLEGEAESWFYSIQKTLIFYDWRELKDKLLLRFGDVADSDRIRLIADLDRFLLKQRADAKLRRLSRTAITPQESISSPATIHETVPVAKFPNQHVDEISGEKKDESHEATMVTVLDSLEEESITQNQVPVSKLEHSLPIPKKSLNVCENSQAVVSCEHQRSIQKTIGLDVVNSDVERIQCVMSISKNVSAHQVLDKMCQLKSLKPKNKRKLSLSLKTWMFKFKNKMLQRNRSQMDPHHVMTSNIIKYISSSSRATFGHKWKAHNSWYWRRMRQTHMSRLLCNLQLILDDLKLHLRHKWKSKHLRAVYPQTNPSYALDVVNKPVIESTNDRVMATALERQAVLEQIMKGVRPALLHNPFPMISRVGILVLLAQRVFPKLAAPLLKVLKSWRFKYKSSLPNTRSESREMNKQGMDLHGVSGLRLFLCQQKFSSIWHRWRRKDSDLKVQLKKEPWCNLLCHLSCWTRPCGYLRWAVENSWLSDRIMMHLRTFGCFPKTLFSSIHLPSLRTSLFSREGVLIRLSNRIIGRRSLGLKQRVSVAKKLWKETEGLPFRWKSEKFI